MRSKSPSSSTNQHLGAATPAFSAYWWVSHLLKQPLTAERSGITSEKYGFNSSRNLSRNKTSSSRVGNNTPRPISSPSFNRKGSNASGSLLEFGQKTIRA